MFAGEVIAAANSLDTDTIGLIVTTVVLCLVIGAQIVSRRRN